MRVPDRSSHCHFGRHEVCADGAAIACRCVCHRSCVCSRHPSLGSRPLAAVPSSSANGPARVVGAGSGRRDNGTEIEGRPAGEVRAPLVLLQGEAP